MDYPNSLKIREREIEGIIATLIKKIKLTKFFLGGGGDGHIYHPNLAGKK